MNFAFCRLEIHKWIGCDDSSFNVEDKSLGACYKSNVYVEHYDNYRFLKERILELTEIAKIKSQNGRNNVGFFICNSNSDFSTVGLSSKGWLFQPNYFYGYLSSYFAKIYGKREFYGRLTSIEKENISFLLPGGETIDINETEIISEFLFKLLVEDFFENVPENILDRACYQEMVEKGYIHV
ncbi:MAG: hypothetical protein AAGE96_01780 [Cyanobacteria bacterium P01_G01_bin.19]